LGSVTLKRAASSAALVASLPSVSAVLPVDATALVSNTMPVPLALTLRSRVHTTAPVAASTPTSQVARGAATVTRYAWRGAPWSRSTPRSTVGAMISGGAPTWARASASAATSPIGRGTAGATTASWLSCTARTASPAAASVTTIWRSNTGRPSTRCWNRRWVPVRPRRVVVSAKSAGSTLSRNSAAWARRKARAAASGAPVTANSPVTAAGRSRAASHRTSTGPRATASSDGTAR
jgi:hypothetical protein